MSTASSDRSASEASPSSASSSSSHSLSSIDGEHLYQLACVETFFPLSKDITPEEEPVTSHHPVARIDYSPNFKFIYGLYRALRGRVEYAGAVAQQRCGARTAQVIRSLHTSPARWLLLLGFTLRQCTSNYTVWKDRRDVLMSPDVLRRATRDQLPALALPDVLLSSDAADASKKAKTLAELEDSRKKIELVAQHWLPGAADLFWNPEQTAKTADSNSVETCAGTLSPWRAVHWELNAVGCFTRFYHKNFQVWHHRRELLSYALRQTTLISPTVHVDPSAEVEGNNAATATISGGSNQQPQSPLNSEEAFSQYLEHHHGLRFVDVDEREIVKTVLRDEDSKNYHAWMHLSWYLHAAPFLLQPPSWPALRAFAKTVVSSLAAGTGNCVADSATAAATTKQHWPFHVHSEWVYVLSTSEAKCDVPASRRPTLPPSPLTDEINFTAQLIHQDCLNNSAWCHRYSLLKEDLMRHLWQEQYRAGFNTKANSNGNRNGEAPVSDVDFMEVIHVLCMVEVDFALQWLYVDPSNESAYTHARSVASLYHTIAVRLSVLRKACDVTDEEDTAVFDRSAFLCYLRDAPLCTPVAAAALDLCATAEDGTVASATPARDVLLSRMQYPKLSWSDYSDSLAVLRHVQRVQHTAIRQRVSELERQAARVLQAAANVASPSTSGPAGHKVMLLSTLYERSSQYMLDNFHQVITAQYLSCQTVLEEMWVLYLSEAQRCAVRRARPPEVFREGIKPEWVSSLPWESEEGINNRHEANSERESDTVVGTFLHYEATALDLAKRLSLQDPLRFKYWKFEAMNAMQRGYGAALW